MVKSVKRDLFYKSRVELQQEQMWERGCCRSWSVAEISADDPKIKILSSDSKSLSLVPSCWKLKGFMLCIKKIKNQPLHLLLKNPDVWIFKLNQNATHIEHRQRDRVLGPLLFEKLGYAVSLCSYLLWSSVSATESSLLLISSAWHCSSNWYQCHALTQTSSVWVMYFPLKCMIRCCWGHIKQSFLLFPASHTMNTSMMNINI